jgi:hypothetical protein
MNGRCVSLIGSGVQTLIFSDAFCIEIKAKEIHGKQTTKQRIFKIQKYAFCADLKNC